MDHTMGLGIPIRCLPPSCRSHKPYLLAVGHVQDGLEELCLPCQFSVAYQVKTDPCLLASLDCQVWSLDRREAGQEQEPLRPGNAQWLVQVEVDAIVAGPGRAAEQGLEMAPLILADGYDAWLLD